MKKKLSVNKINILGQTYIVKSEKSSDMLKISEYVNDKMQEVIENGIDGDSHLTIAYRCV